MVNVIGLAYFYGNKHILVSQNYFTTVLKIKTL